MACSSHYSLTYGPRQSLFNPYTGICSILSTRILAGKPPVIYEDGKQTRDFTFIANVLEANWKAATHPNAVGEAFNIGCGAQTSLNQLIEKLNGILGSRLEPIYETARKGDVRHSVANIDKAAKMLDFVPETSMETGLRRVLDWYRRSE